MITNDNDATRFNVGDSDATQIERDTETTRMGVADNDATQIAGASPENNVAPDNGRDGKAPASAKAAKDSAKKTVEDVAKFAGAGVLLGSASAVFLDLNAAEPAEIEMEEIATDAEPQHQEMEIAMTFTSDDAPSAIDEPTTIEKPNVVNNDMSFDDAFAAARSALGTGSAFEWRGNVYATYTQDEWEAMSDGQKSDFYDNLNMVNPYRASHNADADNAEIDDDQFLSEDASKEDHPAAEEGRDSEADTEQPYDVDAEVEVEAVVEADAVVEAEAFVSVDSKEGFDVGSVGESGILSNDEVEVEVLGVVQDPDTGLNIGSLSVDGNDVYVIDVDGDMVFDEMAADFNNDGEIDDSEIVNIADDGLTVSELNEMVGQTGHTYTPAPSPDIDLLASNDSPDYMSEIMN